MPKVTRDVVAENHIRIQASAAQLFAERGISQVSLSDVMRAAGMTHGGFYRHFESKEDLVVAACRYSFTHTAAGLFNKIATKSDGSNGLEAMAQMYLTPTHRDAPGQGCPVASYASDVGLEPVPSPLRQQFTDGVKYVLSEITAITPGANLSERQEKAMGALATIVGSLLISRAVKGDPVSEQILEAAKKVVVAMA